MVARTLRWCGTACTIAWAASLVACQAASAPPDPNPLLGIPVGRYDAVDLGTLGGSSSTAADINGTNQVAGTSTTSDSAEHAFVWQSGAMTDLGTLGGTWSQASQVNESGQIAGLSADAAGATRAFLWSDGAMLDVGPAVQFSTIRLNQRGQVAWTAPGPGGTFATRRAVLWSGGELQDLGTLGDTGWSQVYGLNDLGQIVGGSNNRAFVWENGVMRELPSMGGSAWATAINNRGEIVGSSYGPAMPLEPGIAYGLLWEGGQMIQLGKFPEDSFSTGDLINNAGAVVGHSYPLAWYPQRAFLWTAGVMTRLTTTFQYYGATDLNDLGLIVGEQRPGAGVTHQAFVWESGDSWLLPLLGGVNSSATAVNGIGTVVGWATTATADKHAVLWRRSLVALH